jgi:hypothetical protein
VPAERGATAGRCRAWIAKGKRMKEMTPASTSPPPLDKAWASVDKAELARSVLATWQAIDAELSPVVGRRGVAAMYQRSLQLSAPAHPWLAAAQGDLTGIDFTALEREINRQSPGDAVTGARAALQAFHDLLVGLVGAALTDRILRPVWAVTPGIAIAPRSSA